MNGNLKLEKFYIMKTYREHYEKSGRWWEKKEITEKSTVKTKPVVSTKRTQVGKKV